MAGSGANHGSLFGDGVVLSGLDLLFRLHIREGMALCVSTMQPERWGEKNRTEACLNHLKRYGTHARPLLPKLKEIRTYLATVNRVEPAYLQKFDENIAAIEASTDTPVLVNLRAFKSRSCADQ